MRRLGEAATAKRNSRQSKITPVFLHTKIGSSHRMIGRLAIRKQILRSMQMALNLLEAARTRLSFIPDDLYRERAAPTASLGTRVSKSAITFTASTWSRRSWNSFARRTAGKSIRLAAADTATVRCFEAIQLCEEISGCKLTWSYEETNPIGDHVWWISDVRKFQKHYPAWKFRYSLRQIVQEIHRVVTQCHGIMTS